MLSQRQPWGHGGFANDIDVETTTFFSEPSSTITASIEKGFSAMALRGSTEAFSASLYDKLDPFSFPAYCSNTALENNSYELWEDKGLLDFWSRTLTIKVIFGPQHSLSTQRFSIPTDLSKRDEVVIKHRFLNELFTMLQRQASSHRSQVRKNE